MDNPIGTVALFRQSGGGEPRGRLLWKSFAVATVGTAVGLMLLLLPGLGLYHTVSAAVPLLAGLGTALQRRQRLGPLLLRGKTGRGFALGSRGRRHRTSICVWLLGVRVVPGTEVHMFELRFSREMFFFCGEAVDVKNKYYLYFLNK